MLPIKEIIKSDYNGPSEGGYFIHKNFKSVCDVNCYTFGINKEPSTINKRWGGGDKEYWGYIDEEGIEWEVKFLV